MSDEAASAPRIVVGVDGSESSKAALRWAVDQAALTKAPLEAIIAWESPTAWSGLALPTGGDQARMRQQAREVLDQAIDEVLSPEQKQTVALHTRAEHGPPARLLLSAAVGARLLIVGSRGHGGVTGALLGSVGQHCVQHAPCPVVIVPGTGDQAGDQA